MTPNYKVTPSSNEFNGQHPAIEIKDPSRLYTNTEYEVKFTFDINEPQGAIIKYADQIYKFKKKMGVC
jgi:hypothetical protein